MASLKESELELDSQDSPHRFVDAAAVPGPL